jgi:hypothetical protein
MPPSIGPGRAELSIVAVPIFENSGQCASASVSNSRSGLWLWGTLSVASSPDMLSADSVVGVAVRLGLNVSWSQPVVAGQSSTAVTTVPV